HYGWNRTLKDHAPAYSKYWLPVTGGNNDDGFSDRIAEKLALPKLLDELDDDQYEVVVALAAHGSQVSAARSLGLSKQTFNRRLLDARDVMAAAWFQPDTPPRKIKPGNDAYCRHGHARDEHSHRDSRGSWVCRPCSRASQRRHTAREGTYHSRHKDAGAA
ncbi:MAG: hypothetical protein OSB43_08940, partial [Nocardioides sp.]|uniref:hypothetical protein n=1 Tax=Nocardioides sp. TaxID=35761 RepID=UPI00238C5E7B